MKSLRTLCACALTASLLIGCGAQPAAEPEGSASETEATETQETADLTLAEPQQGDSTLSYTTVTEGFDWGPAITKVVLDAGADVDPASLATDLFKVSSERIFVGTDWTTFENYAADEVVEREVTGVYVSDAEGNQADSGQYVTIEMAVHPDKAEGSPFNYDLASGFNTYVTTNYIISLAEGKTLQAADGSEIVVGTTGYNNYAGNATLVADDFDLTGVYTEGDVELHYASYLPEGAQEGKTPLIIWLHGAGEGGTNPTIALVGNEVVSLAREDIQGCFGETGAAVLVPQAPTFWMDDGTGNYIQYDNPDAWDTYYSEPLMNLIKSYVDNTPEIDPNRVYLGGCSNGGYETVNLIIKYPGYFAAAWPCAEAYAKTWLTGEKIAAIKDTPIWLTASKTDSDVFIYEGEVQPDFSYVLKLDEDGNPIPIDDFSNALYDQLVAAGASNVHYTLLDAVIDTNGYVDGEGKPYEYNGHWSWVYALNNECEENGVTLFQWMAEQSK